VLHRPIETAGLTRTWPDNSRNVARKRIYNQFLERNCACLAGAKTVQPVPLKRVLFWVLYVVGSLILAYTVLLGLVPGRINNLRIFLFYLTADAIPAVLLLACYLLDGKIMDERNWENGGVPSSAYRAFGFLTSVELVFCVLRVGGMLFYFLFKFK
jgi:hypothetical protein